MDTLISFDDLTAGAKTLKKLVQAFTRAGAPVAGFDVDPRTRRTSGITYRQVQISMTDSQSVMLGIKTTGDIFEVKVNGSVVAIKNQDNQIKAIGEIVKQLDAGRAKFQAKLARQKVALPKGITTAAPKMEERLAQISGQLDTQIRDAKARRDELRAELGEPVLDGAAGGAVLDGAGEFPRLEPDGNRYDRDQYTYVDTDESGEMPAVLKLKADAVPVLDSAADGAVLDSAKAESFIKIAADSIDALKKVDVLRVLESAGKDAKMVAKFIKSKRRDLADEVDEVLTDELGLTLDGVTIPAAGDLSDGEREVLGQIAMAGKVFDGDLVSKSARDGLVERGLVERADGDNLLTPKGQGCAATLDDVAPAGFADMGRSWLGFKLMDLTAAMQASASALPARHRMAGTVRLALRDEDGTPIPVLGTVVAISFRSGKVLYSVAVPIAPMVEGARQIMAVVPDIPSEWVEPTGAEEPALDSVGYGHELKGCTALVLDAVDVPASSFDDPKVFEAQQILSSMAAGDTLDDASFSHALATLHIALDTVETNHPINLAEGNLAQAELEEKAATDFRAAISTLESRAAELAQAA